MDCYLKLDDFNFILCLLSPSLQNFLTFNIENLFEIVLDVGRPFELRYIDRTEYKEGKIITQEDIDSIINKLGEFGDNNRIGIKETLHRISRIINKNGQTIGFTIRLGKPFIGCTEPFIDLLHKNILFLSPPGYGKTSKLRDVARYLSVEKQKRVIIVDKSNEIAGEGNIPHIVIGKARRLQVPNNKTQHEVMIEAVENHTPECIIVDEISDKSEAYAARTIAQRGVQIIATAHGRGIEDLIKNPALNSLIGNVKSVTLSDEVAQKRESSKIVNEREWEPVFDIVIELLDFENCIVYRNIPETVDAILEGLEVLGEKRSLKEITT